MTDALIDSESWDAAESWANNHGLEGSRYMTDQKTALNTLTEWCESFPMFRPFWNTSGQIEMRVLSVDWPGYWDGASQIIRREDTLGNSFRYWTDPGDVKYCATYFERFPGVWCHGDYVELTAHDGLIIYGPSDATLNPGGVRIGTAEIYRQVEQLDEVVESLVIGQNYKGDQRVLLFIQLRPGCTLTDELKDKIRKTLREQASPRHIPGVIMAVPDIPYTLNMKKVESVVTTIVNGRPVLNRDALKNPECLDYYEKILPDLQK